MLVGSRKATVVGRPYVEGAQVTHINLMIEYYDISANDCL